MTDLIRRADAIEAMEARIKWFNGDAIEDRCKRDAFIQALDALSALPSADAVHIPIKLEKRYPESKDEDITDAFMRGYLAGRSSAEAVQGEWVRKYDDKVNCYWYECDQCGEYRPRNQFGHEYNANFCPNCGAKMNKGGDNE